MIVASDPYKNIAAAIFNKPINQINRDDRIEAKHFFHYHIIPFGTRNDSRKFLDPIEKEWLSRFNSAFPEFATIQETAMNVFIKGLLMSLSLEDNKND